MIIKEFVYILYSTSCVDWSEESQTWVMTTNRRDKKNPKKQNDESKQTFSPKTNTTRSKFGRRHFRTGSKSQVDFGFLLPKKVIGPRVNISTKHTRRRWILERKCSGDVLCVWEREADVSQPYASFLRFHYLLLLLSRATRKQTKKKNWTGVNLEP